MKFGVKNPKIIVDGQAIPLDDNVEIFFVEDSNEIEIVMADVNEPPKIKLNGKEIEGIIELDYKYVTKQSDREPGYHNFTVKYCDKETNTIRTVAANQIWEG